MTAPLQDTTRCCRRAGWLLRDIRTWKQDPRNNPACVLGNHAAGPFRIFVPFVSVVPVTTGCRQSGYLASRMSVSTTGWSDNHGPSRGEPWEPVGEQPGSFSGERVGACWRIVGELFASVSSAEPADPKPLAPKADRTFQVNITWQKCCKSPTAGTCSGCKSKCPHVPFPFRKGK